METLISHLRKLRFDQTLQVGERSVTRTPHGFQITEPDGSTWWPVPGTIREIAEQALSTYVDPYDEAEL